MNRLERIAALKDTKAVEIDNLLKDIERYAPDVKEIIDTYYAAEKAKLKVSQYRYSFHNYTPSERSNKEMSIYSAPDSLAFFTGDLRYESPELYYISLDGKVYDSAYGWSGKKFCDTFLVNHNGSREYQEKTAKKLKNLIISLEGFKTEFYNDIDRQLDERERE